MAEMKEVTREQYARVLDEHKNEAYLFAVTGWQVPILHGLVALAADHPGIKTMGWPTHQVICQVRAWCKDIFTQWGFSPGEVEYLDKMREEGKDHAQ